jgi:hypothetical protein
MMAALNQTFRRFTNLHAISTPPFGRGAMVDEGNAHNKASAA